MNGASIIIDQYLVAAEDKGGQQNGLVLLLPHGYEAAARRASVSCNGVSFLRGAMGANPSALGEQQT